MKAARIIIILFVSLVLAISAIAILFTSNLKEEHSDNASVAHTQEVLFHAERVLSIVKDIETGTRGFVITQDSAFLEPYLDSRGDLDPSLDKLYSLTADNPIQQQLVLEMDTAATRKLSLSQRIQRGRSQHLTLEELKPLVIQSNMEMDTLRDIVEGFQATENKLLQQNKEANLESRRDTRRNQFFLLGGIFLFFLLALFSANYSETIRKTQARTFDQLNSRLKLFSKVIDKVVKGISDPFFALDKNHNFTFFNHAFRDVYGSEKTLKTGDNFFEKFPGHRDSELWNKMEKVIEQDESRSFEMLDPLTQLWTDVSIYRTDDGVSVTFKDASFRKLSEQLLDAERATLKTIIDNVPVCIYMKDLQSRKTLVNKEEMKFCGVENEEEIIGKSDIDIYPEETARISLEEDQQVFLTGQAIVNKETYLINKDGSKSWFLSSKIPHYNHDGQVTGLIGISYDITMRKLAEEKKTEFISVASHELKAPITVIKAFTQLALSGAPGSKSNKRDLKRMDSQVDKLQLLIKQLLDVSKMESNNMDYKWRKWEWKQFLEEMKQPLEIIADKHLLSWNINVEDEMVILDELRLEQVLANLVGNAAKYSDPNSEIIIESHVEKQKIIYSVTDRGIGIAKESLPKVFDKYFRTSEVKNAFSGFGMGLYITAGIVIEHGGTIWAESNGLGTGSTFSFTLPVSKA